MLILYQQKNATKLMMTLSKNRKKYFYNLSAIVQKFFIIITNAGIIISAIIGTPILTCNSVFFQTLFNLFILLVFKVIVFLWYKYKTFLHISQVFNKILTFSVRRTYQSLACLIWNKWHTYNYQLYGYTYPPEYWLAFRSYPLSTCSF